MAHLPGDTNSQSVLHLYGLLHFNIWLYMAHLQLVYDSIMECKHISIISNRFYIWFRLYSFRFLYS